MGSNYPDGFESGITIRGIPVLNTHAGNIFWVHSGAGSNAYNGTRNFPFATIDYAIGRCAANNGDIILVKPGHTETLIAAAAIVADVAGIAIIGLGKGNDRPKLTFSTVVGASMTITAASVTIENIIGYAGINALTKPFDVSGNDCHLDIEWQDATDAIEAARAVLATTVSRLFVKIKYVGFITGDACVNIVRLVEVTGARIVVDVYGEISTGIVEMVTTASTDVLVTGYFYNDNVALTKNVVNTGGLACTWYAFGYDGKGGYTFSGGSAAALAADDIGNLAAAIAVIDGYFDVPVADAAGNVTMRDVIGIKTDAAASGAVSNVESLMAYCKQLVTELQVVDGYFDAPTADAATDVTIRDAIGRKTDTNAGTSLMAKQLVPTADVATNVNARDVIGNKTDAAAAGAVSGVESIMAYAKQLVTELQVVDGLLDVPVADAAGNATIRDVVGIKTDAAATGTVSNVESLMAYAKQLVTEGIARDVVIAALAVSGIHRLGKNLAAAAITGTATQFTVSGGPIRVLAMGVLVTTALPAGANTLQFSFTPTDGGATTLSGATDTASAAIQQLFMLDGVKLTAPIKTTDPGILAGGQLLVSAGQGIVLSTGVIQTVFSAGPPATGAITVFIEYEPLVVGAIVA